MAGSFFQGLDGCIKVAAYDARDDSFQADKSRNWSTVLLGQTGILPAFDLAPDGNRLIALLDPDKSRDSTLMRVLLDVDSDVRRTASAPKLIDNAQGCTILHNSLQLALCLDSVSIGAYTESRTQTVPFPFLMLKLTKKADYGLIALRHLAVAPRGTSSAKEIADAYGIPLPLLAKVLQKLTRGHLLQSVAGTNGGYRLAREAASISSLEVIRSIDGPIILTNCFTEHGECDQSDRCTVREPLRHVHEAILELLNGITIQDLARPRRSEPKFPVVASADTGSSFDRLHVL